MENINRLLETFRRSDVRGTNIYTAGRRQLKRPDANTDLSQWDPPSPGLPGVVAIGHHIDVSDLILPEIRLDGAAQEFIPVRNRWTPAFSDTYYRARPTGEYTKSGLLALREQKCFTANDVFVGHLTLANDDRVLHEAEILPTATLPFAPSGTGCSQNTQSCISTRVTAALPVSASITAPPTACASLRSPNISIPNG